MTPQERAELIDELEVAKQTNRPCLLHVAREKRTAASLWLERRAMRGRCAHDREDLKGR